MRLGETESASSYLVLVPSLDRKFAQLHNGSRALIESVPFRYLYWQPTGTTGKEIAHSCGEYVLRSAAQVEQTFGGITANLWDDPFEWTLPATLSTVNSLVDYLEEVDATRRSGFAAIASDIDLGKQIGTPGGIRTLFSLLLETLERASHYQGRAYAISQLVSSG